MYIHRSQGQWLGEDIAFNEGWVGSASCSLAYRADGSPVAAWAVVGTPFKVRVAQHSGTGWKIDTLLALEHSAGDPRVFVDENDKASVLFAYVTSPDSIWIAREEGTVWEIQEALPDAQGFKLAQQANGNPGIVAVDNLNTLYYFEKTAVSWPRKDIRSKPADKTIYTGNLAYLEGDIPLVAFEERQIISQTEVIRDFFLAWPNDPSCTITPFNDGWASAYYTFYFVGVTPEDVTVIGGIVEDGSMAGSLLFYW